MNSLSCMASSFGLGRERKIILWVTLVLVITQSIGCEKTELKPIQNKITPEGISLPKWGIAQVSRDPQNSKRISIEIMLNSETSKMFTTAARGQAIERGMSAVEAVTNISTIKKVRFVGEKQNKKIMVVKADFFDDLQRNVPGDRGPTFVFDGDDYQRIIDELNKKDRK